MRLYFFIFILLITASHTVTAEIYKCVRADGTTLFKDRSCSAADLQTALSYTEQPIVKRDIQAIQRQYKRQQQAAIREKKQQILKQQRDKKQYENQQARRLRLSANCETVKQQIAHLNSRYKQGYTVKQGISLNNKLAELKIRQQKYCKSD